MTGPGRPTLYKPEYASRARELCARGATNPDLAGRFSVARSTIDLWIANHPEFAEAVQQGRDVADARRSNCCSRASPATIIRPRRSFSIAASPGRRLILRGLPARIEGLHVLAAQPPAGGLAGSQRARGGRSSPRRPRRRPR